MQKDECGVQNKAMPSTDALSAFREGQWINIPLPSGQRALARIIHISRYYKDAIGVVVYGVQSTPFTTPPTDGVRNNPATVVLYTNIKAAQPYGWTVICDEELSTRDRELSRRIVGGGTTLADEYLGPASREDEKKLPQMLVYGMPGIYREIEKAFSNG